MKKFINSFAGSAKFAACGIILGIAIFSFSPRNAVGAKYPDCDIISTSEINAPGVGLYADI